jgi:hypothetical protein
MNRILKILLVTIMCGLGLRAGAQDEWKNDPKIKPLLTNLKVYEISSTSTMTKWFISPKTEDDIRIFLTSGFEYVPYMIYERNHETGTSISAVHNYGVIKFAQPASKGLSNYWLNVVYIVNDDSIYTYGLNQRDNNSLTIFQHQDKDSQARDINEYVMIQDDDENGNAAYRTYIATTTGLVPAVNTTDVAKINISYGDGLPINVFTLNPTQLKQVCDMNKLANLLSEFVNADDLNMQILHAKYSIEIYKEATDYLPGYCDKAIKKDSTTLMKLLDEQKIIQLRVDSLVPFLEYVQNYHQTCTDSAKYYNDYSSTILSEYQSLNKKEQKAKELYYYKKLKYANDGLQHWSIELKRNPKIINRNAIDVDYYIDGNSYSGIKIQGIEHDINKDRTRLANIHEDILMYRVSIDNLIIYCNYVTNNYIIDCISDTESRLQELLGKYEQLTGHPWSEN